MKKALIVLALSLSLSSTAYPEIQKDGFDVTTLYMGTKTFNASDARIADFMKYLEKNLERNSSGSSSYDDMMTEESVYLDKKGNSVKVVSEKNTKTGAGTTTITITGPEDFLASFRARLK